MKLNDEGETKPGGLDSTLMTTGLQGLVPPRRPHHENEHAAVVMLTTSCSEVVLRQGGLGVMIFPLTGGPPILNYDVTAIGIAQYSVYSIR